jgi:hypothetical protein
MTDKITWFYVMHWTDPADPDHGTNSGWVEFVSKPDLLDWLNNELTHRPKIKVTVYSVFEEIEMQKAEVTTRWEFPT